MAGRIQLATQGKQDVFFTENPDYTYFSKSLKKHTNFAIYTMDHEFTGEIEFGNTLACTIPQNSGDLLKTVRLHVVLRGLGTNGYIESIGHAIIKYVDMNIGGKLIQRIPRDWLQIYSEHYVTQTKQTNLSKLIGKPPHELSGTPVTNDKIRKHIEPTYDDRTFIIDLPFYFHNNPELAVPLCAITGQEIEFVVNLSSGDKCMYTSNYIEQIPKGNIKSIKLQTEMVTLEDYERTELQNARTDYVITQIQSDKSIISLESSSHAHRMSFVNPVKELYFIIQGINDNTSYFDYDHETLVLNDKYINFEHLVNLQMRLDDSTILDEITGNVIHLRALQSGVHHSRTQLFRRFYSYSFALEPERWYPTGQVNFSLIKEQHVNIKLNAYPSDREFRVYALSYNILRIENGTASLLFQSGENID